MPVEVRAHRDATDEEVNANIGVIEDEAYSIGNPSYKDLVDENTYLRSERSQLYDELARVSQPDTTSKIDKTRKELIGVLESDISNEKNQNRRLLSQFEFLKSEIAHLQFHGAEQATVAKGLEERLEQSQECLHAANAELLQILPLRIKLNEMRQKMELISGEILATNNEMHELLLERDRLKTSLEASTQSHEASRLKLACTSRRVHDLKADKEGELL